MPDFTDHFLARSVHGAALSLTAAWHAIPGGVWAALYAGWIVL